MSKWIFVPALAAALALGACKGSTEQNATANAEAENAVVAPADNVTAKVLNMSDAERNGVLVRAIIDAKLPCDRVEKSERVADQNGLPVWRATCNDGHMHAVSITPDGTANIVSRRD